jgi:hypothetical protein
MAQLGSRGGRTWSMAAAAQRMLSKSKSSLEIFSRKPCKFSKSPQEPYHKIP